MELSVRFKKNGLSKEVDPVEVIGKYSVRHYCEWNSSIDASGLFGEGDLAWEEEVSPEEEQPEEGEAPAAASIATFVTGSYKKTLELSVSDKKELEKFNSTPGVYAIVLKEEERMSAEVKDEEGNVTEEAAPYLVQIPVSFLYLDASSFFLSGESEETITTSVCIGPGVAATEKEALVCEMGLKNSVGLVPYDDMLQYEPLVLNVDNIKDYPESEQLPMSQTWQQLYCTTLIDMGNGVSRLVYMRPPALSSSPGSTTHEPNLHDQEAFDKMNNLEKIGLDTHYRGDKRREVPLQQRVCLLPGVGNIAKHWAVLRTKTFGLEVHRDDIFDRIFHHEMQETYLAKLKEEGEEGDSALSLSDAFLIDSVLNGIRKASAVNPHGLARFRLEGLLNTSHDILKEFECRREEGAEVPPDVVIKEAVLANLRMAKATNPMKWKKPEDISLLESLKRTKGNTEVVCKAQWIKPHHELLGEFETSLTFSVDLHRFVKRIDKEEVTHETFSEQNEADLSASVSNLSMKLSMQRSIRGSSKDLKETLDDTPTGSQTLLVMPSDKMKAEVTSVSLFTRAVLVFAYNNDDMLTKVNQAMEKVNAVTLCDIQGSVRSYSFTPDELAQVERGELDIITGFTVIDNYYRIVVLEGLVKPGGGMESVIKDLPRLKENTEELSMLYNPEVCFPDRLYGTFGPDLKRIRVRGNLLKLATKPEIYNRKLVSEVCFNAIDMVMSLRWAPDLLRTQEMDMYPSAEALNTVELLYGEAISLADIDGSNAENTKKKKQKKRMSATDYGDTSALPPVADAIGNDDDEGSPVAGSRRLLETRNPPTDSFNPTFEQKLKDRAHGLLSSTDFLAEQRALLKLALSEKDARIAAREQRSAEMKEKVLGDANARIHTYASQRENFKIKAYNEIRKVVAMQNDATFTFSKDYVSQTVAAVDTEKMSKGVDRQEDPSKWKTQTGFKYPKPKTSADLIRHPQRPSDSRIEELTNAWTGDVPPRVAAALEESEEVKQRDLAYLRLEKGYTTRIKGGALFGKLKVPEYSKEFELSMVGHRKKLPRGKMTAGEWHDKDPHAFRSVHLVGESMRQRIEEEQQREKDEWKKKVCHPSESALLKIDGFLQRDKVKQFQRTYDILHGEPNRKDLKILRTRKSHGGKDWSYAAPPLSIFKGEPYVANQAMLAMTRHPDPKRFITTIKDGVPKDFSRFINSKDSAPRLVKMINNRKHIGLETGLYGGPYSLPDPTGKIGNVESR